MPRLPKRKTLLIALPLLAVAVIVVLELTNTTRFFHKAPRVSAPGKPITSLPSSNSSTDSTSQKNPAGGSLETNQGTSTDQKGQTPSSVSSDPNQWAISSSGAITLKSPIKDSALKSGGTIAGVASSGPVQYRLIDNNFGVIDNGSISVVNGKFSATIQFKHYGSSGRLDVFNSNADGREYNEVQVPVNF